MAVKKLTSNIQCLFNSSVHLFSYKRAIEELIYNALDAQSTSIAIRIHIQDNKIQVVDNGCGIAKEDFKLLGQKYATSKLDDLSKYKSAPNSYGFRGQSLACLMEVSKHVKITSRMTTTEETWAKTFYKGNEKELVQTTIRPSKGTTVEVIGFLYNLNIQNKGIKPVNEINDIKTVLEQLSFVHNNISFSLRDDSRNEIIFKTHKNLDIHQTLKSLFNIDKSDFQELQVEKNEYKILAYISKSSDHPDRHHWIFLNKKFVNNIKLNKLIHDHLAKTLNTTRRMANIKISKYKSHLEDHEPSKNHTPFYFIFITCPYYDYDISNTPRQSTLEFKNWNLITILVEKLVKFYKGELKLKEIKGTGEIKNKNILKNDIEEGDTRQQVREIMKKILGSNPKKVGVSQMHNGIKGKLIKRKRKKTPKVALSKVVPSKEPVIMKDKKALKIPHSKVIPPKELASTKCKKNNDDVTMGPIKLDELDKIYKKTNDSHKTTKVQSNIHKKSKDKTIQRHNNIFSAQKPKLLTKINKKIKKKQKTDPLVEIFRKQPKLVVERCNILAQEAKNVLPRFNNRKQRVFINETVNYRHIIKDNKNISIRKRMGEVIIQDYSPLKPIEKLYSTDHNHLKDLRKDSLKTSYDLLKTIIGTKSTNTQFPFTSGKVLERNKETVPELTYQSHHYINNHTLSHNYDQNKYVTEPRKNIVHHYKKRGNINVHLNNFSNAIHFALPMQYHQEKKCKSDLIKRHKENIKPKDGKVIYKPKLVNKQFNICSFSDSFTSHMIEFTNTIENKKQNYSNNYSKNSAMNEISVTNGKTHPAIVTSTIGFTYTITTSNETSAFRHGLKVNSKYCSNDCTSRLNYCKTKEMFSNKTNIPQTDQLNVIFISNSNDPNSERSYNEIEPLNVCETILNSNNEQETEFNINDNQTQHNDSLFNLTLGDLSSDVRNVNVNINGTQKLVQLSANQANSVESAIKHFETQETSEIIHLIGNTYERVNINQSIETNNHKQAVCNIEEFEENKRAFIANDFEIRNRLRFLPKGMSPIFENRCWKKSDAKIESGYFANDLYNNFRDEVHTHAEVYEVKIQNSKDIVPENFVKVNKRLDKDNSLLTFNADSLKGAKVLGQIDNKFIASILNGKSDKSEFLVLFDQHAVHERIRLEENLVDYIKNNEWKLAKLENVLLKLSKDEILYLHNYKDKFNQFGLDWTILDSCSITLHGIPAAILGKNPRQVEKVISAVKNLISEEINMIRTQKGCVSLYPKSIMDLVFSEACRYAIKFGDKLPKSGCIELIQALSSCKTPFQCAHGRPVMAVIMDIKPETRNYQINMGNIRKLQTCVSKMK